MTRTRFLFWVVVLLAVAFLLPTVAGAIPQNGPCLACHETIVSKPAKFNLPPVDKDNACKACHLTGFAGAHPRHQAGGNCAACHSGWGRSLAAYVPNVLLTGGAFSATNSQNLPPYVIHTIHATPRWPANVKTTSSACSSCHNVVLCSACHGNTIDPSHAIHGSAAASASIGATWTGNVSVGVVSSEAEDTMRVGEQVYCGAPGCHDTAGVMEDAPALMDCWTHGAVPSKGYVATSVSRNPASGAWQDTSGGAYTLNRITTSNYTGATLTVNNVSGRRIAIVANKDPQYGIAAVSVDGGGETTFDQYADVTQFQRTVYTSSDLGTSGPHTVTIRVTGTKNPLSRGEYVSFDNLAVYAVATDSVARPCYDCHPAQAEPTHGNADHGYTAIAEYNNTTMRGCTNSGDGCHPSASTGNTVSTFHKTGNITCLSSGCHTSPTMTTAWKLANTGAECMACHAGNFTNAVDTTGLADLAPAGHYSETTHTAIAMDATVSAGGTYEAACSVCHNPVSATLPDGFYTQHQGLGGGLGNTTCYDCHNASPQVSALMTDTVRTNTCTPCHNASALPGKAQHSTPVAPAVAGTESGGAGTCATTGCHTTTDLHALHKSNTNATANGCTMANCHDPAAQGVKPTSKSCGTTGTCHTVTPIHPNEVAAHTTLASAQCVVCHETADLKLVHGDQCNLCHGNPAHPTLPIGKLECTSCHNGTDVGIHVYAPIDYNHYTGTETTHTASGSTSTTDTSSGGFSCVSCHKMEMRPEHIDKSSSVFNTATAAVDKCINCHELGNSPRTTNVDAWGAYPKWASMGKTCANCHSIKHDQKTTKHDASAVTGNDACGAALATVTVGSENFDSVTAPAWPATGWTVTGNVVTNTVQKSSGANSARLGINMSSFQKSFDLSAYKNPTLTFWRYQTALDAGEFFTVQYSVDGGANWTTVYNQGGVATLTGVLGPFSLDTSASVIVKFSSNGNATTEYSYVDDILIQGQQRPAGCHNIDDVAVIHNNSVIQTPDSVANCINTCHTNNNAVPTQLACGAVGCHAGQLHAHPYTTASDYTQSAEVVASESGCSNSGAGCHGTVGATRDALPDFHATKTAGCTTSDKCHGSSSFNAAFRASGSGADCVRCHNGGFVNAVDTSALADAAPAGHYSVTTHTADPTNMANTVNAGGTINAACTVCHSNTFRNAHGALSDGFSSTTKGAYLTCQECHGYNAAISALVTDTVRTNTCAACHTAGVLGAGHVVHGNAPVTAATGTGCASTGINCHNTSNLHVIHQSATGGCTISNASGSCHAINKDMTSATKTCGSTSGGCHNTYTEAVHYATYLANHTSTTQSGVTTTVAGVSPTCGSCHGMALNAEHSLSTSAMSGTGSVCLRCHNNAGSTTAITGLWSGELCSACHDGSGITTMHNNMAGHNVVNTGCGNSGVGCHPTQDLSKAGADKTQYIHNDCATCHDPAGAASWSYGVTSLQYNPAVKTCGGASGCHTSTYYSATVHSIGQAKQRNGDDASHTAAAASMDDTIGAYANNNLCSSCHSATLRSAHATTSLAADASCNTGGSTGQGCHNSTVLAASPTQVKTNWPNKTCADCHNVPANVHNTYTLATHTTGVGAVADNANNCVTGNCHADGSSSTDVRKMHDRSGRGCTSTGQDSLNGNSGVNAKCHSLNGPMASGLTMSCGKGGTGTIACHVNHTNSNHGVSNGGMDCYGCHTTYESPMEDGVGTHTGATRTSSFHHVMGSASNDGDKAFAAAAYPTSKTDVYCMSCHADHNKFNASKSGNLRANLSSETSASTDFVYAGATDYTAATLTQTQGTWVNPANSTGAADDTVATSPNTPYEGRHSFSLGAVSGISGVQLSVRSKAYGKWGSGSVPASSGTENYVPTGNGDLSGTWAIVGGDAADWQAVDEYPTAIETTYINNTTYASPWRLFTTTGVSIPAGATINNVSLTYDARWRNATCNGAGRLKVGGAYYDSTAVALASAFPGIRTVTWNTNPRTTVAWTRDDVMGVGTNALQQFGLWTNASGTSQARLAQVYISISWSVPAANWNNDDTWQIDYSVNNGTSWSPVVASNMATESVLTNHTVDLTGILTDANKSQFLVRIKGNQVNTADAGALVDWDASTLSITTGAGAPGICLSCHVDPLAKDNTNQKSYAYPPSTVTPAITMNEFGASAHDFSVNSTFGDATTFGANCTKCHNDEQTKAYQTSTNKFGTHWSAERRILAAMGITVTNPLAEENECYRCHSTNANGFKATTNQDWYGAASMNSSSQAIYGQMSATYKHAVASYIATHPASPYDETRAYISANKHVECGDCHNVHAAGSGGHVPGTTGNVVSNVLKGVLGAVPTLSATNWTAPSAYTTGTATKEYEICFKCHSGFNTNVTSWGGTGATAWTDQALEFSTTNQSYHPVVAALPVTDPGTNGSSRLQANDMANGWANGDTMYCSDCHAASASGSLGPHGSAVKWMLKGPNQAWPYTTAANNGTSGTTNFRVASAASADALLGTADGLFCRNCHDVMNHTVDEHNYSSHNVVPCVGCHIRVPHGGKVSRLLQATGSTTLYPNNMPARYTATGNGSPPVAGAWIVQFGKSTGGTYSTSNCAWSTTGYGGETCGGSGRPHAYPQTGATENW